MNRDLELLVAAIKAYDAVHARTTICATCGASWELEDGYDCRWCAERALSERERRRQDLLNPTFLTTHHGYIWERLGPEDRKVWDATRGNDGSEEIWGDALRNAVDSGLITMREADAAVRLAELRLT